MEAAEKEAKIRIAEALEVANLKIEAPAITTKSEIPKTPMPPRLAESPLPPKKLIPVLKISARDILGKHLAQYDSKTQFMAEECTGLVEERVLKEIKAGELEIVAGGKLDTMKLAEDVYRENLRKQIATIKQNMKVNRDKFTKREWEAKGEELRKLLKDNIKSNTRLESIADDKPISDNISHLDSLSQPQTDLIVESTFVTRNNQSLPAILSDPITTPAPTKKVETTIVNSSPTTLALLTPLQMRELEMIKPQPLTGRAAKKPTSFVPRSGSLNPTAIGGIGISSVNLRRSSASGHTPATSKPEPELVAGDDVKSFLKKMKREKLEREKKTKAILKRK